MENILLHKVSGGTASAIELKREGFNGSDCTGSDGDTNRVLTTSNVSGALGEIMIFIDTQYLRKTDDYTVSGNDITFLIKVWDTQKIDVHYIT